MTIFKGDVTWGYQPVRSSYCVGGDCVTVSVGPGRCVMVWNSQRPLDVQVWEPSDWDDLLRAITGRHAYSHSRVAATAIGTRWVDLLRASKDEPPLFFTRKEWEAFVAGVLAGEFNYDKLCSPALVGPTSGRTAATGAVESVPTPAPVVAAFEPLANAAALVEVDAKADGPGLRLGPAMGAGEASAASSRPAPVVAGMNAAGYAAMSVPAGRAFNDASSTVDGADHSSSGQPGSQPSEYDVDELADFIAEARRNGAYAETWTLARWLLSQGYRRDPSLMDAEAAWQRMTAPLVPPPETSRDFRAVEAGWARPDGLVNEAGEVGPANPRSGPTEPAFDCMCRDCRALRGEVQV